MTRRTAILALPVLALSLLLVLPEASFAQFRGFGRGGWGGGGWGGSSWSYPTYGNYGGWTYGNYGMHPYSSYGYSPYTYSSPYYYSGYGPNYGNYGWSGYSMTQPYAYSTPSYFDGQVTMPANTQQSFYPPDGAIQGADANQRAFVHIRVPANAQVFFDNSPTQQMGPDRMFVTPPLQDNDPKHPYQYKIKARWMENGQEREATRTVQLTPGRTATVDFMSQQDNQQNPQQLNRPQDNQQQRDRLQNQRDQSPPNQQQRTTNPPRTPPPDTRPPI
jgi:uncharacterized protein (TIGR03000 family)